MARFSPTGYWAVYTDDDSTTAIPVVEFQEDFRGDRRAVICAETGLLCRADEDHPTYGTFAWITHNPEEE